MANQTFADLYISDCENCGVELEDWDWLEDEMRFHTTCTCGTEHILEPTLGVLSVETDIGEDGDEDIEC